MKRIKTIVSNTFKKIITIFYSKKKPKKNVVLFTSFGGQYSDGPKMISLKIHYLDPKIKVIWALNKDLHQQFPHFFKRIKYGSLTHFKYTFVAKCLVDNVFCGKSCFLESDSNKNTPTFIDGQFLFSTWHGTPIKRMGRDAIGNKSIDFVCGDLTLFHGNTHTMKIMEHLTFGKTKHFLTGEPRNDIYFKTNDEVDDIKESLGIPKNKKIVLFAPTFRSQGENGAKNIEWSGLRQINELNIKKLLEALSNKFDGEWVFVCRFHQHVRKKIDWDYISRKYGESVLCGDSVEDINDYLMCSDALITDASSCMFDLSISNKPVFIFFPDYLNYKNVERGFYLKYEELPFVLSQSTDELISSILNFDEKKYKNELISMRKKLGFFEDGKASERCAKVILEKMKQ